MGVIPDDRPCLGNPPAAVEPAAGYRPRVGDLVGLPAYLSDRPYRVLAVSDSRIPGWVHLGGYLIHADLTQWHCEQDVPIAQVRKLHDPVWPEA